MPSGLASNVANSTTPRRVHVSFAAPHAHERIYVWSVPNLQSLRCTITAIQMNANATFAPTLQKIVPHLKDTSARNINSHSSTGSRVVTASMTSRLVHIADIIPTVKKNYASTSFMDIAFNLTLKKNGPDVVTLTFKATSSREI